MKSDDVFAYVLDEELVRSALPDWPAGMTLILCLQADGGCQTVVGHRDEAGRTLRKAAAALGLPERSFAVAPEVPGWPTRRVRFSEEQDMLNLVAEAGHLVELATDYAINYRFAKDEGLSPEAVTGGARRKAPQPKPRPRPVASKPASVVREVRRRLHLGLPSGPRMEEPGRAAPAPVASRIMANEVPGMPAGFAPSGSPARAGCLFGAGHIGGSGGHVRVVLAPELATIQTRPVRVAEIGFSADFWRFYLPREALDGWQPGRPAVIDIPGEAFPEALRNVFAGRRFHVDATVTPEGVFLAPGAPIAPRVRQKVAQAETDEPEIDETETMPAPEPKRRRRTPLRAAMTAVLVAGTAAGAGVLMLGGNTPELTAMLKSGADQ